MGMTVKERSARYRASHPARVAEASARYRAENVEKLRARTRAYAVKNREKRRENLARYKARHPEKVKAARARYRAKHLEALRAKSRAYTTLYRVREVDKIRARYRRAYETGRALLTAAKNRPCADCGIRYPSYVMDFDHVRGTKSFQIGTRATTKREKVEAEIAKCDVVCANCHRERTQKRRPEKKVYVA